MSALSNLSIDEQQWLLIIRAGGRLAEIPAELRDGLISKGMAHDAGESLVLTDEGATEATRIAAADLVLALPPAPA